MGKTLGPRSFHFPAAGSPDMSARFGVRQGMETEEFDTDAEQRAWAAGLRQGIAFEQVRRDSRPRNCVCETVGAEQREHIDGYCIPRYITGS